MKIAFSDTHKFEKDVFSKINHDFNFDFEFLDYRITDKTAASIENCDVICSFVSDNLDRACLTILKEKGIKLVALRSAGFNHVDLEAASDLSLPICRVPSYSPNSVAEFTLGLLLTLNRKIHRAFNRVHELNFSLDGLVGFDLNGKTVGVLGAGRIGKIFVKAVSALGCRVLVFDPREDNDIKALPNVVYSNFENLIVNSDIISAHIPLTKNTHHLINADAIAKMKPGVTLINTSRGGIIDATALITGLKSGHVGGAALDVYEEEEKVFFKDFSSSFLQDDVLARLLTFPNVLITSHQAFLTYEALNNIARTTCESIQEFRKSGNVSDSKVVRL